MISNYKKQKNMRVPISGTWLRTIYLSARDKLLRDNLTTVVDKLIKLLLPQVEDRRVYLKIRDVLLYRLKRGRKGLKEFKEICLFATKRILGCTTVDGPSCKVPRVFWMIIRKSKNSFRRSYFALCLLQIHRLVRLPVDLDVSTITSPFTGSFIKILGEIPNILKSAKLLAKKFKVEPMGPVKLKWSTSTKAGPNGTPAVSYGKEDLKAIMMSTSSKLRVLLFVGAFRFVNLSDVGSIISNMYTSMENKTATKECVYENRLAFLPDKGGKTRIVGIGNMYYQSLLRPIHDYIFSILKRIPMDGTHDHVGQASRVQEASSSNRELHSVDMTACTDRFPAWFQAVTLFCVGAMNAYQSISWYWLIALNSFHVRELNKDLTYTVGQPMGYLSSWAAMALSHHHLVHWAFVKAYPYSKGGHFNNYAIIGDDIVIWDTKVATEYYYILNILGIEYNKNKSFRDVGIAEFAKGYYRKGHNLKPLSPDLLLWNKQEGVGKVVGLLDELKNKPFSLSMSDFEPLFRFGRDLTTILHLGGKDKWIFDSPRRGDENTDLYLAVCRLNSGLRSLKRNRKHFYLTVDWIHKHREVYGDILFESPYIALGDRNSRNIPGVKFCSRCRCDCNCEQILLGDGWIAYSKECWPGGLKYIQSLLDKAVMSGLTTSDLAMVSKQKDKNVYLSTNTWKKVQTMSTMTDLADWLSFKESGMSYDAEDYESSFYIDLDPPSTKPKIGDVEW